MNLYAVSPCYAPHDEVKMVLAKTDKDAKTYGSFIAYLDQEYAYCSPSADVYLIARGCRACWYGTSG